MIILEGSTVYFNNGSPVFFILQENSGSLYKINQLPALCVQLLRHTNPKQIKINRNKAKQNTTDFM
jgi:hypothetical protein